jgi:DNA modification methylase
MSSKKSYFSLPYQLPYIDFEGDAHMRYTQEFAEKIISEFTKEGDIVFDPFAGFGTTLIAAQTLNRIGYGIEYEEKRCDYIKRQIGSVVIMGCF